MLDGKYRLLQNLAAGSLGEVWEGEELFEGDLLGRGTARWPAPACRRW